MTAPNFKANCWVLLTTIGLSGLEGNVTSKDITCYFQMAVIRAFFKSDTIDYEVWIGAQDNYSIICNIGFKGILSFKSSSFFVQRKRKKEKGNQNKNQTVL